MERKELIFATGNEGKVRSAQKILDKFQVKQSDIDTVEPSIDSIGDIALSKVEQASDKLNNSKKLLIADDSGLFVNELNGFPGPQTHYFDKKVGKNKLLKLVEEDAEASFKAAIAFHLPERENKVFKGEVKGNIVKPKGSEGFGYDPLFKPEGSSSTWGEDSSLKQQQSHRKEALINMKNFLEN